MPNISCPRIARKYTSVPGPIGQAARGFLDGREGKEPAEASPEYESAWLDGAGDRAFLLSNGRAP